MPDFNDVWTDKMLTGVEHIDAHHRHLVKLLVDACNASEAGSPPGAAREILSELVSYTKYHFAAEERLMMEIKYPRLKEQREAHRWFTEELNGHFLTISGKDGMLAAQVFVFLREWYAEHILKHDIDIGIFMRSDS